MRHQQRIPNRHAALAALALSLTLGACSMDQLSELKPRMPNLTHFDWDPYSRASQAVKPMTEKKVTPADYVNADGSCAGGSSDSTTGGPAPVTAALLMTECDVVKTLGRPENVEIGSNQRGERQVIMLYTQGQQPGRYRFTAGRLTLIEQLEQAAPAPKAKKPAAKRRRSVS
jgi:hypothetical protein